MSNVQLTLLVLDWCCIIVEVILLIFASSKTLKLEHLSSELILWPFSKKLFFQEDIVMILDLLAPSLNTFLIFS